MNQMKDFLKKHKIIFSPYWHLEVIPAVIVLVYWSYLLEKIADK